MSDHDVKHDYHIIDPSPWPLMGSAAAMLFGLGLVAGFHGLLGIPKGNYWLFYAGLAGILLTMLFWWLDVIKESRRGDHTPVVQLGLRYGTIMFIASEVMFFVAWFWAFFDASLFPGEAIQEARTTHTGGIWPPCPVKPPVPRARCDRRRQGSPRPAAPLLRYKEARQNP